MTSQPMYLALWDKHEGSGSFYACICPHAALTEAEQAAFFQHTKRVLVIAVGAHAPLDARIFDRSTGPHAQVASFKARLLADPSQWSGGATGETFPYEASRAPDVSIFWDSHEARLSLATVYALGQLVGSARNVDEVVHSMITAVHVQEKLRHLLEDRFDFLYQVAFTLYRYLRRAGMADALLRPVLEAAVRALRATLADSDPRRQPRLFNRIADHDALGDLEVPRERELRWFGQRNGVRKSAPTPTVTSPTASAL